MLIRQSAQYGQFSLARRFARTMPWVGAAIAVFAIASAVRRKGLVGGTLDSALNALPFVGTLKNTAELARGRDFIPNRRLPRPGSAPPA
jgi:hypothetical protein